VAGRSGVREEGRERVKRVDGEEARGRGRLRRGSGGGALLRRISTQEFCFGNNTFRVEIFLDLQKRDPAYRRPPIAFEVAGPCFQRVSSKPFQSTCLGRISSLFILLAAKVFL
jgi:hypothetical protein